MTAATPFKATPDPKWVDNDRAAASRVFDLAIESLQQMAGNIHTSLPQAVETIAKMRANKGRLIVTGMGKSGHVARKIAATLASTGAQAMFVHPAEASHGDLGMIGPDDVILALSKSGEARELSDVIDRKSVV